MNKIIILFLIFCTAYLSAQTVVVDASSSDNGVLAFQKESLISARNMYTAGAVLHVSGMSIWWAGQALGVVAAFAYDYDMLMASTVIILAGGSFSLAGLPMMGAAGMKVHRIAVSVPFKDYIQRPSGWGLFAAGQAMRLLAMGLNYATASLGSFGLAIAATALYIVGFFVRDVGAFVQFHKRMGSVNAAAAADSRFSLDFNLDVERKYGSLALVSRF